MTVVPIVIDAQGIISVDVVRRLRNQRTSGEHPNYCIIKIGQNTEKSPERVEVGWSVG